MGCLFATLTMLDSMAIYAVVPGLLGLGILATSVYYSAAGLACPLWLSKKLFRYIVVSIFLYLLLGYLTVRRDFDMAESR